MPMLPSPLIEASNSKNTAISLKKLAMIVRRRWGRRGDESTLTDNNNGNNANNKSKISACKIRMKMVNVRMLKATMMTTSVEEWQWWQSSIGVHTLVLTGWLSQGKRITLFVVVKADSG